MEPVLSSSEHHIKLRRAIVSGNIETLIKFWTEDSLYDRGVLTRTLINQALERIARRNSVPYKDGMTFPDVVDEYDFLQYSECLGSPDDCLRRFAREGKWRLVIMAIREGAKDFQKAAQIASWAGHHDIAEDLLERI